VTREKGRERCCVEFYVLLLAAGSRLTNLRTVESGDIKFICLVTGESESEMKEN
jgi:hypothetical protein